jgi:hypothetical protein
LGETNEDVPPIIEARAVFGTGRSSRPAAPFLRIIEIALFRVGLDDPRNNLTFGDAVANGHL